MSSLQPGPDEPFDRPGEVHPRRGQRTARLPAAA